MRVLLIDGNAQVFVSNQMGNSIKWKYIGQSLVTKLIVAKGYNLTQYLFIGDEFDKSTIGLNFLLIFFILAKFLKN